MSESFVPLGDLCKVITKGTTPTTLGLKFSDSGIPFLRAQNISNGGVNYENDMLFIDSKTHHVLERSKIHPGDVLVSIAGTIGRAGVVPDDAPELNCNQAVAILRPKNSLVASFLRHWLEGQAAQRQMRGAAVTGTISNLSLTQVGNLRIPLLPVEKQRRIAGLLDKADAVREKRRQALVQLDIFSQSIFLDLFGDPISNSRGWNESKVLGEIAEIVSGVTKGRDLRGKAARQVPYLAVINVQDKYLDLSVVKTIDATEDEIERYKLQLNDLLLTEGGDPDKLGRGTLWNCELPECIHQNHIFRVRLTTEEVHPVFLNWLIGSQRGKKYFLRSAKQTTGIASINMTQLRGFPMLLPPLSLQIEFAKRFLVVEKLKKTQLRSSSELDTLFMSLQDRAFRGEL